jgi:hypothetical protein
MAPPRIVSVRELKRCLELVSKMERLNASTKLSNLQIDLLYESACLTAYVAFEVFIERQFVALLVGKPYYRARKVRTAVQISGERTAYSFLRGQNRYPKFLPLQDLMRLANLFFVGGRPFSTLDKPDRAVLDRGQLLRNAIAHRSRNALSVFRKQVLTQTTLPLAQQTPAGYLRSRVTAGTSQLENEVAELMRLIVKLS